MEPAIISHDIGYRFHHTRHG